jgi:thiamine-phosphate diphosphorylase
VSGSSEPRAREGERGHATPASGGLPRLHVLLSGAEVADRDRLDAARRIAGLGSVGLHLRARAPARILFDRAVELARAAGENGGWCVVNGRPDIALAASAQAVQLGRGALPVEAVRRLRPETSGLRIGASVHDADGAVRAVREGADYLIWGTAYETPSHPGRPGSGAEGLRRVVEALEGAGSPLPVLAIGGIDRARVPAMLAAGAAGVVVGRAVWSAADPVAAAEGLLDAITGYRGGREGTGDNGEDGGTCRRSR